jgi:hypothetical protein
MGEEKEIAFLSSLDDSEGGVKKGAASSKSCTNPFTTTTRGLLLHDFEN